MADHLGTVALLTRAADLAEKAAAAATQGTWQEIEECGAWYVIAIGCKGCAPTDLTGAGLYSSDASLIAASGPDHWRAAAAGYTKLLALHERYWAPYNEPEHHCRNGYFACEALAAVRESAELVVQQLDR